MEPETAVAAVAVRAAKDARNVFESYGSKAREAIDYMEQLIYASLRKSEPAEDVRTGAQMADLSLPTLLKQTREDALREAAEAVNKAREAVIYSGNRAYIDGISVGHNRAERAILALIPEAKP